MTISSQVVVSIDAGAWWKALIACFVSFVHDWFKTGAYLYIKSQTEYKHYLVRQILIELMVLIDTDVYGKMSKLYAGVKSFQDWGQFVY